MASLPPEVVLALRTRQAELPRLHAALEDYGRQCGLPARSVSDVQLALEEHLTNIMVHGCAPGADARITVRFRADEEGLHVGVEDEGRPFNPLEYPAVDVHRPVEERPMGGLGIHMIRRLVDDMAYRRQGRFNILTLRKRVARSVA
jgi:serine/threonine-protein kinase RsbW